MNLKKIIMPFIQAAITLLLLWYIFKDPTQRRQMATALESANLWWVIPGFLCFGLVLIASTVRWSLLLAVQEIRLGWLRTWQLVMIGMFFNLFLLGSTGGDVLKTFYAMLEVPQKKTGLFLSILLDRLVGMFALMIITLIIGILYFSDLWATLETRTILMTAASVFGGFLFLLLLSLVINHYHLWKYIPQKMPGYRFLMDIASAFSSYARSPILLGSAVLTSFVQNGFLFGTAICAAYAFAALPEAPGAGAMIKTIPLINTISSIPISIGGIGVREKLFETLLHTLYGTPGSLAVLISLTYFFLSVLWSLLGGLVYLFYRPTIPMHLSFKKMADQVHSVEENIKA